MSASSVAAFAAWLAEQPRDRELHPPRDDRRYACTFPPEQPIRPYYGKACADEACPLCMSRLVAEATTGSFSVNLTRAVAVFGPADAPALEAIVRAHFAEALS